MKTEYWVSNKDSLGKENLFALNDFLLTLKSENKSHGTVDGYRRILENFFLGSAKNISKLTPDDVIKEIERMSNGISKTTKSFYMHVLSSFFTHCRKEGYINQILMKKRWNPKLNRSLSRGLDKSEQAKLRMAAERLSLVHRVIVEFLLTTGCRRNELRLINISDIDIKKRSAKVHGKGNKWRIVFFSESASIVIRQHIENHPKESTALLVNKFGNRVSNVWIWQKFKECVDEAGLRHEISPHYCRHAFAGNLLSQGKEEGEIKDLLDHNNFQTTDLYLDVVPEKVIEWYYRCMR